MLTEVTCLVKSLKNHLFVITFIVPTAHIFVFALTFCVICPIFCFSKNFVFAFLDKAKIQNEIPE